MQPDVRLMTWLASPAPDRPNNPPDPREPDDVPEDPDDVPDTPPTEPPPVPIRDPKPDGQPSGPYITRASTPAPQRTRSL